MKEISILQKQNGYRIWRDSFKSKKYDSTFELNSSFLQIYACSGYAQNWSQIYTPNLYLRVCSHYCVIPIVI